MHRNCSGKPTAAAKQGMAACAVPSPAALWDVRRQSPVWTRFFLRGQLCARRVLVLFVLALFCATGPADRNAFAQETDGREYPLAPYSIALPFPEDDQQSLVTALLLPRLLQAGEQQVSLGYFPGRGGSYAWREISGKESTGHVLAVLSLPTFFLQA